MTDYHQLLSVCILDGRNRDKMEEVSKYFSEFALIKNRVRVEIEYLLFLSKKTKMVRKINKKEEKTLMNIWQNFSIKDAIEVKEIEKEINHDVKAVEYFLRQILEKTPLSDVIPFIHFGLTSYDINIPSYGLMLSEFRSNVLVPKLREIAVKMRIIIESCNDAVMLGRTHGQPALPTTLGKELAVFYRRIIQEGLYISSHQFEAKLTGAVGNYNALQFTYPEYDWIDLSQKFVASLGLKPNIITTQIIPYDNWLRYFDSLKRLNNILLGFCQDIWWYISFEYFGQLKKEKEVGSSTMAHKINPITFENAEGNLQLANSLFEFFVRKLAVTRLQRDLSDSTLKRDFGLSFGFTLLAWDSIISGLSRITPNPLKMKNDLEKHWEVFSEGLQTYLRAKGQKKAYEVLKEKTRGKTLSKEEFYKLIGELPLNDKDREKLRIKSLDEYLGLAKKLTEIAIKETF